MEAVRYKIEDETRGSAVSAGATLVNSAREPLTALRVMVEGLGAGEEAGLWLTHVSVVPMVPRISPFDLVYLDANHKVVECAELLPATVMPRFKKPASSALVLPFRTISSARIEVGDQFVCEQIFKSEDAKEVAAEEPDQLKEQSSALVSPVPELIVHTAKPVAETDLPLLNPFLVQGSCAPLDVSKPSKAVELEFQQPAAMKVAEGEREEFVLSRYLRPETATPVTEKPRHTSQQEKPKMFLAPKRNDAKRAPRRKPSKQSVPQKREPAQATTSANEPGVNRLFRWLYPALYEKNRRSADRLASQGLVAYEFTGDEPRMHVVANISSYGLYLETEERWESGKTISLTLQPSGPIEGDSLGRVEFDCTVERVGADGVGMSILLPAGMELKLWEAPGRNGADPTDAHCILRELRMARALAFMRRICSSANEEVTEMFHKTLSNVRAANIVEIALRAERILEEEPEAYSWSAHRDLLLKILEHGSWVDVDWLQDLWAGLLATSCTFEGQDESNVVYVNLLSKLAPLPTQILTVACAKAVQSMTASAVPAPTLEACSAEEIASITRSNNLLKIYKSIGELSELGLVEKNPRSVSPANPEAAKAMPTQLGLQMFARCNGQRSSTLAA